MQEAAAGPSCRNSPLTPKYSGYLPSPELASLSPPGKMNPSCGPYKEFNCRITTSLLAPELHKHCKQGEERQPPFSEALHKHRWLQKPALAISY